MLLQKSKDTDKTRCRPRGLLGAAPRRPRSAGFREDGGAAQRRDAMAGEHLRSEKISDIVLQSRHNAGVAVLAKFARSNPRNHGTETGRVFDRKTAVSASILPKQMGASLFLSCAMQTDPFLQVAANPPPGRVRLDKEDPPTLRFARFGREKKTLRVY